MGKSKKQWTLDAEKLAVKEHSDIPDQFHSSELQAFEALRRRGVAMAFADLISWECHERCLQQLTSHLRADPPPNYIRPTLPQVPKADQQVFLYLIRVGVDLKRQPDNSLVLDNMIFTPLQSYEVGFHLLSLPKQASKPETSAGSGQPHAGEGKGKSGSWRDRPNPYRGKGGGSYYKGKSKGGKSVLPKCLLGREKRTWIHMVADFVSIRW